MGCAAAAAARGVVPVQEEKHPRRLYINIPTRGGAHAGLDGNVCMTPRTPRAAGRDGELQISPRTGRPRPARRWFVPDASRRLCVGAGEPHMSGALLGESAKRTFSPSALLPFFSTLPGRILRAPAGRDPKQLLGSRFSLSPCAGVAALLAPSGTAPEEAAAPAARARTAPRPSEPLRARSCGHQHLAHFPLHLWQMPALSRQEHKEPSLFGSSAPRRLLPRPVLPPAPLPSRNRSWTQPELLSPAPRSASPPHRSPFDSVVSPIQTKTQEVHSEKVCLPFAHFEA